MILTNKNHMVIFIKIRFQPLPGEDHPSIHLNPLKSWLSEEFERKMKGMRIV